MTKIITIIAVLFALGGCISAYQPVTDMQGVDPMKYKADLDDCRKYAEQVDPAGNAVGGAVLGTAVGAAGGALIGSASGAGSRYGARVGAASGAVAGTTGGLFGALVRQRTIVNNCMTGRGYRVLE